MQENTTESQNKLQQFLAYILNIVGSLEFLFKLSLALGAFISWMFFTFYVGALPSFGNIGDVATYLVLIVLSSSLILVMILLVSFPFPFFLKDSFSKDEIVSKKQREIGATYFMVYPLASIIIYWLFKDNVYFGYILFFMIVIVSYGCSVWLSWIETPEPIKFRKLFQSGITKFIVLLVFSSASFLTVSIVLDINFYYSILLLLVFIGIGNAIILLGSNINKTNYTIGIGFFLIVFSAVLPLSKIDNPIIVKPFELLKLGHYKAELHFNKEFMINNNPFPLNENNSSSNTFLILSSIGDEYILKEVRHEKDQDGHTVYRFDFNQSAYCYDDKSFIGQYDNKECKKIQNVTFELNATANKLRNYWKKTNNKVYRFKKEDVTFEVTGNGLKREFTAW